MKQRQNWMRQALPVLLALCLVLAMFPLVKATAPNGEKIVYGYSGEGRELTAYRYGNGENVLVVGFALHGFEDNFVRDGQALVYTAEQLMNSLSKSGLAQERGWSVYVLPCMNPDGLYSGHSHDGPGRCTTRRYNGNDVLVDGGVDLNRCFPTNFVPQYTNRNYTGASPMMAKEARALSQFIQSVKGSGTNILIDTHGWFQQTIVFTGRDGMIYSAFHQNFPQNVYTYCGSGNGYLISYAHSLGYDACLFEMPDGIYSLSAYYSSGYCEKYISSIETILKSQSSVCANGHSYETTRVEPTCTKAGSETKVCTRCGDTQTETLPALGHSISADSENIVQAATATKNGFVRYTCQRCDEAVEQALPKVFQDTDAASFYSDAVDYAYAHGLVNGMRDDTFGPSVSLTRGMLVTILHRYAGAPTAQSGTPFTDLDSNAYYYKAVEWAYENGVVNGVTETQFRPNELVTRQQTAAILHRYVELLDRDNGVRGSLSAFTDSSQVHDYAKDSMAWCVGNGIIQGMSATTIQPTGNATRAQSVVMLYRVIRYLEG